MEWMSQIEHFCKPREGPIRYPRFTAVTNRHKSVLRTLTIEVLSGEFTAREDFECEIGFSEGDVMIPLAKSSTKFHMTNPVWSEKFEFRWEGYFFFFFFFLS